MPHPPSPQPTSPRLTWPLLLARWTDFARASAALPTSPQADRWRHSIAPAITLQAVAHALAEAHDLLEPDELALALDKAELLIKDAAAQLNRAWAAHPMPQGLIAALHDARQALRRAASLALLWSVAPGTDPLTATHPADLVGLALALGFSGDLYLPAPGIPLFPTCPAAWLKDRPGQPTPADLPRAVCDFLGPAAHGPVRAPALQAYREFDFAKGGPVRDRVLHLDAPLPAGQPLLVPAILDGQPQPISMPPRSPVRLDPLPVLLDLDQPKPADPADPADPTP